MGNLPTSSQTLFGMDLYFSEVFHDLWDGFLMVFRSQFEIIFGQNPIKNATFKRNASNRRHCAELQKKLILFESEVIHFS